MEELSKIHISFSLIYPFKLQTAILSEINLLRKVQHENIIKLYEVYESQSHICLILEYLNGGELFDKIKSKRTFEENEVQVVVRHLLNALDTIHSANIIHRDLKPENLIFASDDLSSIKISDFGLSTKQKEAKLFLRCGSPGYVGPEILNDEGYDTKTDLFSLGIIVYIMITGKFVFSGKSPEEVIMKNTECKIPFP